MDMCDKVAVVTGANKGLGLGIVKELCIRFKGKVYLTSRDKERGKVAVSEPNELNLYPEYHQLDVTERRSVEKFRDHIKENHGGIDILINNAGIATNLIFYKYEEDKRVIDTNYRSILTVEELLYPLIRDNGRVLNISSDCGHLSNIRNQYWRDKLSSKELSRGDVHNFVDWFLNSSKSGCLKRDDFVDWGTIAAYRVSKVALSAMTILQQRDLEGRNISVNSMHPGVIRTDMTSRIGFFTPEEAAVIPVNIVLDAAQCLKGAYVWHDGTAVDWSDYHLDYSFKSRSLLYWIPYSFTNMFSYIASRFWYR